MPKYSKPPPKDRPKKHEQVTRSSSRPERGWSSTLFSLSIICLAALVTFDLFLRMNILPSITEANFSNTVYIYGSKTPNETVAFDPDSPQPKQEQPPPPQQQSTKPDKPTCRDLMRMPNSPYLKGEFLTRFTTPIEWHPRADGSRRLDHSMCTLHRYTVEETKQCLKGKHVHFIGDSLTRYQFMSLAWFLERGSYPPRWERPNPPDGKCHHVDEEGKPTCSPPNEPNICNYGEYNSVAPEGKWGFQHFIQTVGGPTVFGGRMEANGVRTKPLEIEHWTDNYVYASAEERKQDKVLLSYFQEVGWNLPSPHPIHGFQFTGCFWSGTCTYSDAQSDEREKRALAKTWDLNEDLTIALDQEHGGTLYKYLPAPVDVFLYNRGIWGPLNETRADILMPLMPKHTKPGGRCYFQSSTGESNAAAQFRHNWKHVERNMVRPRVTKAGCGFIDLAHLVQDFVELRHSPHELGFVLSDNVHFRPWVYEEINNMLLNILCNAN